MADCWQFRSKFDLPSIKVICYFFSPRFSLCHFNIIPRQDTVTNKKASLSPSTSNILDSNQIADAGQSFLQVCQLPYCRNCKHFAIIDRSDFSVSSFHKNVCTNIILAAFWREKYGGWGSLLYCVWAILWNCYHYNEQIYIEREARLNTNEASGPSPSFHRNGWREKEGQ